MNPPTPELAGVLYFARILLLAMLWAVILYATRYLMRDVAPPAVGRAAGGGGHLVVKDGLVPGAIYPIDGEVTIGRTHACTVRIDDAFVSMLHARITQETLEDMGSQNGTFVRGERIAAPRRLIDGDEIRIGPATLVYRTT